MRSPALKSLNLRDSFPSFPACRRRKYLFSAVQPVPARSAYPGGQMPTPPFTLKFDLEAKKDPSSFVAEGVPVFLTPTL